MRGTFRTAVVAVLLSSLAPGPGSAQDPPAPAPEYAVKAAILLSFVRYAEWPAGSFASDDAPIVVGVLPPDPFGAHLADAAKGRKIGGRPVALRVVKEAKDWEGLHLLFVPAGHAGKREEVLKAACRKPVLTVGESDGFAKDGGILNLYLDAGTVKFEANPAAAERQGIVLSSKLLKLARVVAEKGGAPK